MTWSPGAKACGEVTGGLTTLLLTATSPPFAHLKVGIGHSALAVEFPGLTKNGVEMILSHLHGP